MREAKIAELARWVYGLKASLVLLPLWKMCSFFFISVSIFQLNPQKPHALADGFKWDLSRYSTFWAQHSHSLTSYWPLTRWSLRAAFNLSSSSRLIWLSDTALYLRQCLTISKPLLSVTEGLKYFPITPCQRCTTLMSLLVLFIYLIANLAFSLLFTSCFFLLFPFCCQQFPTCL